MDVSMYVNEVIVKQEIPSSTSSNNPRGGMVVSVIPESMIMLPGVSRGDCLTGMFFSPTLMLSKESQVAETNNTRGDAIGERDVIPVAAPQHHVLEGSVADGEGISNHVAGAFGPVAITDVILTNVVVGTLKALWETIDAWFTLSPSDVTADIGDAVSFKRWRTDGVLHDVSSIQGLYVSLEFGRIAKSEVTLD
nr:hypothetical protein Iba_chr14bCG13080 [Ipomoea batatas]